MAQSMPATKPRAGSSAEAGQEAFHARKQLVENRAHQSSRYNGRCARQKVRLRGRIIGLDCRLRIAKNVTGGRDGRKAHQDGADAAPGQFELNEDQRAIQAMAEAFAADRVAPNALDWDREQAFPCRRDPRDRPARLRRHLCARRCRRLGPRPARRRADLRGAGARLPGLLGLHLDPQHDGVDDRPLRQRGAAPALSCRS